MIRIQYNSYGGPEVLNLEHYTPPALGPKQVLILVKAASVNPVDWKMRAGQLKMLTGKNFPRGMGNDFAGIVQAVGSAVSGVKPGDEVFGAAPFKLAGSFAEQLVTEENLVAVKPPSLSFAEAATIPTVGVTAWIGLVEKAKLKAGQSVFINGCMGGVGRAAVQIAKLLGATVTGTCNKAAMDEAKALGVDIVLDYQTVDLAKFRKSFNAVFDTAVTMSIGECLKLLRPNGKVLDLHPVPKRMLRGIISGAYGMIVLAVTTEILNKLSDAVAKGKLKAYIGQTVPLAAAMPALTTLERTRIPKAKLVITIN